MLSAYISIAIWVYALPELSYQSLLPNKCCSFWILLGAAYCPPHNNSKGYLKNTGIPHAIFLGAGPHPPGTPHF